VAAQAAATAVDLCVEVTPLQPTSALGQPAQWSVAAWATGGSVAGAVISLQASPVGTGTPQFSFGCGSSNGTSTCNLGTVDADSAQRQFQAQLAVPLTSTVSAVSLTATGSATGLLTGLAASASVTVLGTAPIGAATSTAGLLPGGTGPSPTAGSTAGLYPTLNVSAQPTAIASGTTQVASTSIRPSGDAHLGVELVGLVALAVAFILAVTRVSVRRPPVKGQGGANGPARGGLPPARGGPPSGGAGGPE
jgi:hypothetical protein